eukprot:4362373-Lingulodinium_polyedra.AAC.1
MLCQVATRHHERLRPPRNISQAHESDRQCLFCLAHGFLVLLLGLCPGHCCPGFEPLWRRAD